jgi:hypothetical protein
MLTNIPDNTPLYLLAPKCEFRGAPEPQRLEGILFHHTDDGPRFSVTSDKLDRPYRHYIHVAHLVNYYGKYVGPVSGYAAEHPLEFLFLADGYHKDRSLKDMEADRLEFFKGDDCVACAVAVHPCRTSHKGGEEAEEAVTMAPPLALPPSPEVEAFRARLAEIEKKVDTVLACQEMLRRLEAMKLNLKW